MNKAEESPRRLPTDGSDLACLLDALNGTEGSWTDLETTFMRFQQDNCRGKGKPTVVVVGTGENLG